MQGDAKGQRGSPGGSRGRLSPGLGSGGGEQAANFPVRARGSRQRPPERSCQRQRAAPARPAPGCELHGAGVPGREGRVRRSRESEEEGEQRLGELSSLRSLVSSSHPRRLLLLVTASQPCCFLLEVVFFLFWACACSGKIGVPCVSVPDTEPWERRQPTGSSLRPHTAHSAGRHKRGYLCVYTDRQAHIHIHTNISIHTCVCMY